MGKGLEKGSVVRTQIARKKAGRTAKKVAFAGIAVSVALDPKLGLPIGLYGIGKGLLAWKSQRYMEKAIMKSPALAREIAEKAKGTEVAGYFEALAIRAEGKALKKAEKLKADLQRLKYREFLRSREGMVREILQRRAEIKEAGRQSAERNKRIEERVARERKIRKAKQRAKNAALGMASKARKARQAALGMTAMARKLLGKRKKRQ